MSLREWTGWRVAAAWVLWAVLASGAAFGAALAYAFARDGAAPRAAGPAAGPAIVSPRLTIELNTGLVLLGLLGPPALLTAAWLWQRLRHR